MTKRPLLESTGSVTPSVSLHDAVSNSAHASNPVCAPESRKLSVVHVGKFYPPHMGGMETHLEALCGQLRKSVDLQVIVANDGHTAAAEILDGVPVSRLPTALMVASTPLCPAMLPALRHCQADILHLHFPNPMAVAALLASGYRGRVVVTYHSDMVRQKVLGPIFEPFLHAALRRSSAIIATSPNYLLTSQVLQQHQERCHVIPLGISIEEFDHCDPQSVATVRQQYGDRIVVSVGRLVYYKGFEYLIRAMTKVSGNLVIIGDGPLRGELEALARELGIAHRVYFLGKASHERLVACYHAAQVFVLPSVVRSEAFGIAQVEAMAAGLPVVNTRLDSGVPFVSLHEQTGLTVAPADWQALALALNQLLDDPDRRRTYAIAARRRARQEFSLEAMVARTLSLYGQVMESPRPQ